MENEINDEKKLSGSCCKPDNKGNLLDCCKETKEERRKGLRHALYAGLLPHVGCIFFLAFTILGVTTAAAVFRPLLMNAWFFYSLIALSFGLTTISAAIYLKKHNFLSKEGVKKKKGYLATMYGMTLGINLLLFMVVFPLAANASPITGAASSAGSIDSYPTVDLSVKIPCPGHAPLITENLRSVTGVINTQFSFPNNFKVWYNPSKVSIAKITSLAIFKTYPATVEGSSAKEVVSTQTTSATSGGCGCGGGGSTCGGTK